MKCLCEKGSGLCSVHSTSPYIIGCPSWGTSSEPDLQKPSLSKSLSLKVDVLPQQCQKSKPLSFQFQELDSSSTQPTGQSYPEVCSAQSGFGLRPCLYIILNICAYRLVFCHFFLLLVYIFPTVRIQKSLYSNTNEMK